MKDQVKPSWDCAAKKRKRTFILFTANKSVVAW